MENYFNQKKKKINSYSDQDSTIVRCMECIQRPGDVVFVPSMWHHAVLNVRSRIFFLKDDLVHPSHSFFVTPVYFL